jgi:hypothetical protein
VSKRTSHHIVALGLAVLLLALLAYRLFFIEDTGTVALPERSFHVDMSMEFTGNEGPVTVEVSKPISDDRQKIFDEQSLSEGMSRSVHRTGENRWTHWESAAASGKKQITYSFGILTQKRKYLIPTQMPVKQVIPDSIRGDLVAEANIQSTDSLIVGLASQIHIDTMKYMEPALKTIYTFVTDSLRYVNYSGTTDAITTLKLGEASCGGKSRLFTALCRSVGIPARLVGGKILHSGSDKVMHIWVEVWINGFWVPFCPTNHYYAEIPIRYLKLYVGDEPFLTHTEDINFKYDLFVKERLVSREDIGSSDKPTRAGLFNLWTDFRRAAVSVELLRLILMLPLGALAVVIFRNIVGLQTYGTFMPALIALAFRDTGLLWGLAAFSLVIVLGLLLRSGIQRLQLLHTPRLAIMLTFVVVFLLALASVGSTLHVFNLARVSMFPMVILTMTVERAAIMAQEGGIKVAIRVAISTAIVASITYLLMEPQAVQSLFVTYPEMLLAIVILNIYVGRYSGLRLSELWRFRGLAFAGEVHRP